MAKSLKIISWNVHYPNFSKDNNFVVKRLQKSESYDVICLQEFVQGADNGLEKWLTKNNYSMEYMPFEHRKGIYQGIMIATKKSLKAKVSSFVLREDEPMIRRPYHNIRGLLDAHIKIGSTTISIVNTHLTYARFHTRDMRQREFEKLKSYLTIKSTDMPRLICGDFNFIGPDKRRSYLIDNFNSFTGTNGEKTWHHMPKFSPLKANLDYFFWNNQLSVKPELGTIVVSDHKPLFAEISVK